MTISKSKNLLILICLTVISCNNIKLFEPDSLNSELILIEDAIMEKEPSCKYITVYFAESDNKDYLFISSEVTLNNIHSEYYMDDKFPYIIAVFGSDKLEKKYANTKIKKSTRHFNDGENTRFYENQVFAYEILKSGDLKRVSEKDSKLINLNKLNILKFVEPVK